MHPTFARDYEYKRHGTVSLLAGIDLITGKVHALVKDRHRSREFTEFLKLVDAAYPTPYRDPSDPRQSFRPHLQGDESAGSHPAGGPLRVHLHAQARLLAELGRGLLLQLARSVLRHIRIESKQELKDRIMATMDHFNGRSVVHTWSYKLDKAA